MKIKELVRLYSRDKFIITRSLFWEWFFVTFKYYKKITPYIIFLHNGKYMRRIWAYKFDNNFIVNGDADIKNYYKDNDSANNK